MTKTTKTYGVRPHFVQKKFADRQRVQRSMLNKLFGVFFGSTFIFYGLLAFYYMANQGDLAYMIFSMIAPVMGIKFIIGPSSQPTFTTTKWNSRYCSPV